MYFTCFSNKLESMVIIHFFNLHFIHVLDFDKTF